jgi:hypothetical protein
MRWPYRRRRRGKSFEVLRELASSMGPLVVTVATLVERTLKRPFDHS